MVVTTPERVEMERKTIRVSKKRQITIPLEFFEKLNLTNEVDCSLEDNAIVIKPIRRDSGDDFSVEILKELVDRGLGGVELVAQFQVEQANLRKAVQRMIEETDRLAEGTVQGATLDEVFGSED